MFRFTDSTDHVLMFIGTIAALATGAAIPIFVYFWGKLTDVYTDQNANMV